VTIGEQADLHEVVEMMRGVGIRLTPGRSARGVSARKSSYPGLIHRKSTGYTIYPGPADIPAPHLVLFA
jgi:hypothetical protein